MKYYQIKFTPAAEKDMNEIDNYIRQSLLQPATSSNLIKKLLKSISSLKSFPYKYPLVQEFFLSAQGVRCMPVKKYYIFYKISEEKQFVIILRVAHHCRNWTDILNQY